MVRYFTTHQEAASEVRVYLCFVIYTDLLGVGDNAILVVSEAVATEFRTLKGLHLSSKTERMPYITQ